MAEYVELIDKYRINFHDSPYSDYDPPSYEWVDNTGEIVRCKDCVHKRSVCIKFLRPTQDDFYCAFGKRRGGDAE